MKKFIIVTILCLLLVGCGSKKKTNTTNNNSNQKETIDLGLGIETKTFNAQVLSCGSYSAQSKLIFSADVDENGQYKGTYEFYECNDNNINLETADGTYSVEGEEITFIDSYGQTLVFEATDDNTIVQKENSKVIRTFQN